MIFIFPRRPALKMMGAHEATPVYVHGPWIFPLQVWPHQEFKSVPQHDHLSILGELLPVIPQPLKTSGNDVALSPETIAMGCHDH